MSRHLPLSPNHRNVLETLLREHLPDVEVWAYGGRVYERSHDGSDLDLVLRGPMLKQIPVEQVANFVEAVRESALPFLVAARDWASLPKRCREKVERDHVEVCQSRASAPVHRHRHPHSNRECAFQCLFAEPTRNGLTRPKAVRGSGVKMVNMGELFAHPRLKGIAMDRVPLELSKESHYLLQDRDLLFARQSLVLKGAGKCSIFFADHEPTTFESHVIRVRLDPSIADPLYYYYYWQSHQGRSGIRSIVEQGAGASGIRSTDLATLPVAWPGLEKQRAIAHILGTLDDKIELNRRMNEALEGMARALFKSWFVDFEPVWARITGRDTGLPQSIASLFPAQIDSRDVPVGWRTSTLDEVAFARRKNVLPTDCDDETPYIGLEHMPRRSIALGCWGSARGVNSTKSRFQQGDILFGKLRPYFHKVGIASVTGVCSTDIVVVAPKSPDWSAFVTATISSDQFVSYTDQTSTGTKMPRTSWKMMGQYPVCLPPRRLAVAYQEAVKPAISKIVVNIHASLTLASLRDALLPKLISGEICVQEAEKAVAEVL